MQTVKVDEVVFREDLYPRFEPRQDLIERYAASLEFLPPIKISQSNILIDGFHRLKAHELAEKNEINAEIIEIKSDKELKKMAYQHNSNHGLQLSNEEKKKYAQEMIGEMSAEELSLILSITPQHINEWTKTQRESLEKERNRKVIKLYLRAWNTQQAIADEMKIPQNTISVFLKDFIRNEDFFIFDKGPGFRGEILESEKDAADTKKNGKGRKIEIDINKDIYKWNLDFKHPDHQISKPFIYNIWDLKKQDKETSHFGAFPQIFMENLLYYHTQPFDIIFDPFAGTGTTIDACKKWYRRYYCSDLKVKSGREEDIKEWDITQGLPEDLQKPDLVFLDPPYWKQAQGKYSDSPNDLSNMDLDRFNETMSQLLTNLSAKRVERIAIVIQPTQYANDFIYTDHIFDFHGFLRKKYEIEIRYILPYSTQQYNAQMVDKAKEKNRALVLHRDLVVWKRIDTAKK